MQESSGIRESTGPRESTDTDKPGDPNTEESRSGPGWKGWVLSILVAIILSVTATLLLGGSGAFRSDRSIGAGSGHSESGARSVCCPPAAAGK